MLQELLNQTESPGNASWTSDKMLFIIAMFAVSGVSLVVALAVVLPDVLTQLGMVILGLGGFVIGLMATILVVWNFNKMLKETGFR